MSIIITDQGYLTEQQTFTKNLSLAKEFYNLEEAQLIAQMVDGEAVRMG